MSRALRAQIQTLDHLAPGIEDGMFAIYNRYYEATSRQRFLADLNCKTHVVLLFDEQNRIRGFSTIARYFHTMVSPLNIPATVQVLFSGDTIIEHDYWGQQTLPIAWIEQAGRFKAQHPDLPLYWLLIVKGYRTYRYLSVFTKKYYPAAPELTSECARDDTGKDYPSINLQSLSHGLASEKFNKAYNKDTGCIVFPESHGHLAEGWADIPERVKSRPEVAYFLARNPGFHLGHELVCLTELCADNLTRRARTAFERGLS